MLVRIVVFLVFLLASWFTLASFGIDPLINIGLITTMGVVAVWLDWLTPELATEAPEFKFKEEEKQKETHVILWDRSSVDLPNLAYLQKLECDALYFCTTTGVSPDLSLIRAASKVKTVNHWEYRTDNDTHLKLYLLLSLYHVYLTYGDDAVLHVFTKDPDLKMRFKLHSSGYNFKAVNVISTEVLI